jgi:hypothetical protein
MWYMEYDETITTGVEPARAWAAVAAVTTWPQWTTSMTTVAPLDGTDLAVGRRYRVKQPGFPPVVWRVTELRGNDRFSWEARSPGVHTVAYHEVVARPEGGTQITIGVRQTGVLSGLLARLTAARTRHYLELEAAGLKPASEA